MTTGKTNTEDFKRLEQRIKNLEKKNRGQTTVIVLFIILSLLLTGFIIYSELEEPPFGKWKQLSAEKKQTELYNDYLLSRIDSINRSNDLLLENSPYYTGVFYEVQIGAFQYFDLNEYQEALQNLRGYKQDSLNKYVLGKFRDLNQAKLFLMDVRKMGVLDAFLVAKINGTRVEIKRALEAQRRKDW